MNVIFLYMNFHLKDDLRMQFSLLKRNDARGVLFIICIICPVSHKYCSRTILYVSN